VQTGKFGGKRGIVLTQTKKFGIQGCKLAWLQTGKKAALRERHANVFQLKIMWRIAQPVGQ